jgi:hypothetical protein
LVVAGAQVELGEEAGAMKFINELFDHGDRKFVFHRAPVESSIVDAKAPGVVGLPDE